MVLFSMLFVSLAQKPGKGVCLIIFLQAMDPPHSGSPRLRHPTMHPKNQGGTHFLLKGGGGRI